MLQPRQIWQVFGKAWAFGCVFVGAAFLSVIFFPAMSAVCGPSRERAQRTIHGLFTWYVRLLRAARLVRFEIRDAEKLAALKGCMVIANHPSVLDVVVLMALIPHAQCIVKHELWNHFFMGGLMRHAGYIKNDLDAEELVAACQASLAQGDCLIIFPEGTRTPPGQNPKFQRGFANIATLTKAPIQTVMIEMEPPFLFKGEPWWHGPTVCPVMQVRAGEYLDPETYIGYDHRGLAARALVEKLQDDYKKTNEKRPEGKGNGIAGART